MVDYIALFETGTAPPVPDDEDPPTAADEGGSVTRLWPEGDPLEPVEAPSGKDLAAHLDWPVTPNAFPEDDATLGLCQRHVSHVTTLVHSHTRGRGFSLRATPPVVAADLAEIIISAAAHSVSSPEQSRRVEVGSVVTSPTPFAGFTLAEQAVLNRYRPRVG